jgi:drug/metabolite transporter (DMT)-like permease
MTVIYVVPVFGLLWGALFLDEAIHLSTIAGGAVILLSVWLITRRSPAVPVPGTPAEAMTSAR